MDSDLFIKVNLGVREYPIKIKRDDARGEEVIRQAAANVNDTFEQIKSKKYKKMDEQDFFAMVALLFAIKALENEQQADIDPIIRELRDINLQLGAYLEKE